MRILFQGDSVTDAGRSRTDLSDLGPGYPFYTAKRLTELFPEKELSFLNRGISGNRSSQLLDRLQEDFLDLKPDLVTILIGVNDSWHGCPPTCIHTSNTAYESNYRAVLEAVRGSGAKIVMLEPFLLPNPAVPDFRDDLNGKIKACRRLAAEYACAYLPLDGMLFADAVENGLKHLSDDGVHPNAEGRKWIGERLADVLAKLI